MKIYKYIIWIAVICTSLFAACSDEERGPVVSDSTIPGNVSNVQVERLPGAIKLKYDLPNDQALAYVKAECVMNGIKREVKASAYNNNLIIQGFPDTCSYQINLYSVNRSEVVNPSPVTLSAKPLNPPFQDVYKTLSLMKDFGGATVTFENPMEADLAITLMYIDSLGYWSSGETLYTKRLEGSVSIRNMDTLLTSLIPYVSCILLYT